MATKQKFAIAILCTEAGEIIEIISDDFNLINYHKKPLYFEEIVDNASKEKANNFIRAIDAESPAFDWEINIFSENQIRRLNFSGVSDNHKIIIVGIEEKEEIKKFTDELTKINSEQANILRRALKEKAQLLTQQGIQNNTVDELSRLNNELTNLQRELTKKNIELEKLYHEMRKIAIHDRLTETYNRWGFYELAEREIKRAKRHNTPLSLVTFDLDYFKKINDTYGHTIGDLVLKKTAARCKEKMRSVDIFCRSGGEEFIILMPDTKKADALCVAERIRQLLSEPIAFDEISLSITVSLGVASLSEKNSDLEKMMICADKALYHSKETGRNKVSDGCDEA